MNRFAFSATGFSSSSDGRYSYPIFSSPTTLRALVPDGAFSGASSGALRVENLDPKNGLTPLGYLAPPFASNSVEFSVPLRQGDVGKVFYAGTSYTFTLETGAAGEEYLVILFNSVKPPSRTTNYGYRLGALSPGILSSSSARSDDGGGIRSEATANEAITSEGRMSDRLLLANGGERHRSFERGMRQEVQGLLERLRDASGPAKRSTVVRASITGPGAPPQTASFLVIADPEESVLDPDNYVVVQAQLKFEGAHTLLYVDQSTHATCITDQEAADLGRGFDEGIYATNRLYFGSESDMNADGRVAILLTPVVNRMTPPGAARTEGFIAGFFNPVDLLFPYVDPGVTNGMEIFYTIVPDPTSRYGNEYPKTLALDVIRGTLAHEFQHMIMFNYRVLIYGQGYLPNYAEKLWLDEGLSHIAEDLNGHHTSNINRANLFLEDPGNVTLIHGGDELDERGASFLFLRYLGDRCGNGIFKQIVQSKNTGTENIERVAGEDFIELFADWSAACYLSGRSVTSDPRFAFTSIDLRGDFEPLFATVITVPAPSDVEGDVKSMGPEFIRTVLPALTTVELTIGSAATGKMNAVIIRLQ